jgi:hypothetical protein
MLRLTCPPLFLPVMPSGRRRTSDNPTLRHGLPKENGPS